MKSLFVTFLSIGLFAITACKKNQSDVQGMVRYIDSAGFYHTADSASMTLFQGDTSGNAVTTVSTGDNGVYQFIDIADGDYQVYGYLMIDSNHVYTGASEKFSCKRSDFIPVPIDLD